MTNQSIVVSFDINERVWHLSTNLNGTLISINYRTNTVQLTMGEINTLDQDTIDNLFHVFIGLLLQGECNDYDQWYEDVANKVWTHENTCTLNLNEVMPC